VSFYSPAQASEKTGFSIDTLRYYERVGLLHEVGRTSGGRRKFSDTDVMFLQLLRCLRDVGMPIAEMLRFVTLLRGGEQTRAERVAVLREHDRRVGAQIERLVQHRQEIQHKIELFSVPTEKAGTLNS
jgi:DNA-binding transcriptional MerR regulator